MLQRPLLLVSWCLGSFHTMLRTTKGTETQVCGCIQSRNTLTRFTQSHVAQTRAPLRIKSKNPLYLKHTLPYRRYWCLFSQVMDPGILATLWEVNALKISTTCTVYQFVASTTVGIDIVVQKLYCVTFPPVVVVVVATNRRGSIGYHSRHCRHHLLSYLLCV